MTGYMAEMRKLVGHRTIIQCAASVICVDGEMEELRFFPCEQIDLDEIHPPIRRVVEEFTAKQKNRF